MTPNAAHLDFVIIGAMKAGTTSLFEFLAAHPDVCAPRNKEPHYFTRGYNWPASYYRRLFRHRTAGQICGEASPTYSWVQAFPETPERIATDAPDARLIFTIRDPLDRVLSHIRHQDLLGGSAASVAEALAEPALWERSSYQTTIEAYLAHVPREQLLVVDLADLQADDRWLRHTLDYLGLSADPLEPLALPAANVSDERFPVPGFVTRIAVTPTGSMIRDFVPKSVLERLKRTAARFGRREGDIGEIADVGDVTGPLPEPTPSDDTPTPGDTGAGGSAPSTTASRATYTRITKDDIRAEMPDACAELEAQYAWARAEFIDPVEL